MNPLVTPLGSLNHGQLIRGTSGHELLRPSGVLLTARLAQGEEATSFRPMRLLEFLLQVYRMSNATVPPDDLRVFPAPQDNFPSGTAAAWATEVALGAAGNAADVRAAATGISLAFSARMASDLPGNFTVGSRLGLLGSGAGVCGAAQDVLCSRQSASWQVRLQ
eukprot:CAMPEP_0174903526 /NCGR_PEP_ID=MMETSP0167-20121228/44183_1 /TAXON_ID=38298 /ORGANISM="Rhodella maculata, Strain CCMP736" /LENGTH=163 /DNA_ID=CAMNT_0016145879 /DNA_START=1070 /DNA_END=1562 /DNA_ORIENTATION=-